MVTRLLSGSLWGVEGRPVTVEVDVARGLPAFDIVGLAGPAVREARQRVRAGLKNAGFQFPLARITVNLAPADLRKQSTGLDLAMALGILHRTGQIPGGAWQNLILLAELSLNGELQPLRGTLPILYHLARGGAKGAILAAASAAEAQALPQVELVPADDLQSLCAWIQQGCPPTKANSPSKSKQGLTGDQGVAGAQHGVDLAEVEGQQHARQALEIAAAGGHNLLMVGPPGTGKSTLARCLPTILPPPTEEEALEILLNYSAAGEPPPRNNAGLVYRPYRAPHHSIPPSALIGGGVVPEPGEISLAHRGVLFLDEIGEFKRRTLENLREPLGEGFVTISRLHGTCRLPAAITLVAAMNPCPCGFRGDPLKPCNCTELAIKRYWATLSGPLLDRIDLQAALARPSFLDVFQPSQPPEPSAKVRERVLAARELQAFRLNREGLHCNAEMGRRQIERFCQPDDEGQLLLQEAYQQRGLTMRGYHGALKLARTVADLAGAHTVSADHIALALDLRHLDRPLYGQYAG